MNDLGVTAAWAAIQAALVLIPAAGLRRLASRRSPDSAAWVATAGLALALASSLIAFAPCIRTTSPVPGPVAPATDGSARVEPGPNGRSEVAAESTAVGWALSLATLRGAWDRLGTTAAAPVARCRPLGALLASVFFVGAGAGLVRLACGLCGVRLCTRRSRPVDDAGLLVLLGRLRDAMGCRREVEVREASELASPAVAGWRRPAILLPPAWRSWDEDERRAVLAHELAHVARGDYAAGILARLALSVHFYNPLARRLASGLLLDQELAADALAARFAGGRGRYLRSLSRLTLSLDEGPPCWPTRSFLAPKGGLIRRIAMLRDENRASDRPWSRTARTTTLLLLGAVAAGAASFRGPALGDEPKADDSVAPSAGTELPPFNLSHMPDDVPGLVAGRPAAIFRRSGMGTYRVMLNLALGQQWAKAANRFGFDPTKPGQGPPRVEMLEEASALLSIYRQDGPKPNGRLALGEVLCLKTTESVDWPALFRLFKQEVEEASEGGRTYYRIKKTPVFDIGPGEACFFRPDERTVVFASEARLRRIMNREAVGDPAPARGEGWDRASRGLAAVALDNRDGRLTKAFRAGEPDEVEAAALFQNVEKWAYGIGDGDSITLAASASCPDPDSAESTAAAVRTLAAKYRKELEGVDPSKAPDPSLAETSCRLGRGFFEHLIVDVEGRTVAVRSPGLGLLSDLAAMIAAAGI